MTSKITLVLMLFVSTVTTTMSQSVGIGTETPNANAILELVAPNNDQGLLVPRMSTAQRTTSTFTSNLSTADNGLMVYDQDENRFYFWIADQWVAISTGNLSGLPDQTSQEGKFLSTNGTSANWSDLEFSSIVNVPSDLADGDDIDDADNDPTNEIQDLSVSGSTLSLTGSSTTVDLTPFTGTNTDEQDLDFTAGIISLSGDPDATTIDLSNYDADASDDFDGDFSSLTSIPTGLSDGDNVNDADSDPTNEIQDISSDGTAGNLSLSDGSTLTLNVEDGDSDAANELQDLSISSNTLSLSASAATIDLSSYLDNTDQQDLDFTSGIISLSGDPDATSIDLSNYDTDASDDFDGDFTNLTSIPTGLSDGDDVDDADNDPGNEIQDISSDGTAGNLSLSDGSTLTLNVEDGDSDATNEIQDLSVTGSTLSLTGSSTTVDLTPFTGTNTDEQDLDFTAGIISLSGDPDATTIDLSNYDADASDDFDGDFSSLTSIPTGLSDGDDVNDADSDPTNEIQDISSDGTAGNLSLSDGSTLTLNVEDGDSDAANEFQDLSISSNTLSLSASAATIDLSSYLDNTDQQDLDFTSGIISLSGDPDATAIDLSNYDTDASDDFDGDFTNLTSIPTGLSDGDDVDDADNDPINEIQDISSDGTAGNLSLSDGSTLTLNVEDGDADDANEFQDLTLSGNTLSLTNSTSSVDLSPFMGTNTDNQTLGLSGADLTISGGNTIDLSSLVDDADNDPNNENQTVSAGTGISISQTDDDFEVTNTAPDQTVAITDGGSGNVTIGGTYPSFTIDIADNLDNDPNNENQTVSAGTGISISQTDDDFEVTNTAPDQTVAIADGGSGNVTIGGTYPSFTIDVADNLDNDPNNENQTVSAGTGISISQTDDDFEVTNTAPDQTVAIADGGSGNVTIGGTYPSFTIDVADNLDNDPNNENQTVSAGTGISISQTDDDFEVTNTAPDQTVAITDGGSGNVTIGGTYPSFTIDVADNLDNDPNNENQTVSAGTGISISQTDDDFEVTNTAPDQTVAITDGGSGNVTIGGTYPSFTIDVADNLDNDPNNENQTVSAGTGISVSQTDDDFEVTNTAPDQTVAITDGGSGNVTIGGTYPSFTIDVADNLDNDPNNENQTVSAGTGISISQTDNDFEVTNTAPDQTVAITDGGSGNVTIGGTYPSFTIDVADNLDNDPNNENQTVSAGTGISISQTEDDFEVTNTAPDQTVAITDGGSGNVTIGGTYPSFTIDIADNLDNDPNNENQTVSAGTGISISQTDDDFEVTNTAPDQTVAIADGGSGNVTIGGTYPSFTIDVADNLDNDPNNENQTVSAGTGISISQTDDDFEVTNTAPDQTVSLSNAGNVTIGGTYPNFTLSVPTNNDNSSSNEYNTGMSISGTSIRVTDGGGTRSVNIGGTFATDAELESRTFEPAAFKATIKSQATIPGSSSSIFIFNTTVYDITGDYDAASGTYAIQDDGLYTISGLLTFASSPAEL